MNRNKSICTTILLKSLAGNVKLHIDAMFTVQISFQCCVYRIWNGCMEKGIIESLALHFIHQLRERYQYYLLFLNRLDDERKHTLWPITLCNMILNNTRGKSVGSVGMVHIRNHDIAFLVSFDRKSTYV